MAIKNLLFIADPHDIHSIKKMSFFSKKEEYKCYLICLQHQYSMMTEQQKSQLTDLKISIIGAIRPFSIVRFNNTFKDYLFIKETIKKYNVKSIVFLYAEPNALWGIFNKNFNTPMVLFSYGTDVLVTIPNFFRKKKLIHVISSYLYAKAIRNFYYVLGTSYSQIHSITNFSRRANNIDVIRTGVEVDRVLADTSSFRLKSTEGQKYIFFPRMMEEIYFHEFSLEAIELLPQEIKNKYKFVFLDCNSKNTKYVKKIKSKMLEISDVNFVFLPRLTQEELFETYKSADLVIMNPKSDGAPVSALESMLCGTPLILGPLEYDPDLFSDVFRLNKWDPKELCDLIVEVLNNPDPYKNRILACVDTVLKKADRKIEMTKLENIVNNSIVNN